MMKKLLNLKIAFLLAFTVNSTIHAQPFKWAFAMDVTNPQNSSIVNNATAVDNEGNVYVAGSFSGIIDFDPGPGVSTLNAAGGSDAFLAKYTADGKYIWAKRILWGKNDERIMDITIDKYNSVYIVGFFSLDLSNTNVVNRDTAYFDTGSGIGQLVRQGGWTHLFWGKYDSDGNYQWMHGLSDDGQGRNGEEHGYAIAVDNACNVYITGQIMNFAKVDFDPGPGVANLIANGMVSADNVFFASYDTDGNYRWAKCLKHSSSVYNSVSKSNSVAVNDKGDVYFAGWFSGIVDFDPGPNTFYLGNYRARSSFISKFDTNGNWKWAKAILGDTTNTVNIGGGFLGGSIMRGNTRVLLNDLDLDNNGDVYVTGCLMGKTDFSLGLGSGIKGIQSLEFQLFSAKYDGDGNYVWAHCFGDQKHSSTGNALVVDGTNLYITGGFGGTIDFDPGNNVANLVSLNGGKVANFLGGDIFIAKYDTAGNYLCAQRIGGLDGEVGSDIAVYKDGSVYVAGEYQDVVDFDPGPDVFNLTSPFAGPYGIDAFLLKLACDTLAARLKVVKCGEDSYILNDSVYAASGIYNNVLVNGSVSCGCDSIIILDLTLSQIEEPIITIDTFILGLVADYSTYQWIKNGTVIQEATQSEYLVTENADYQVAVTNESGCADTSAIYKVTNYTGIDTLSLTNYINIYPNPTNDLLYISNPTGTVLNISLTGIEGIKIMELANAPQISLQDLAHGIYFIHLTDQDGNLIKIEKVVKQ